MVSAVASDVVLGKSKRVIVVGAGWSGLAAAKTYLELDPSIDLTILEADSALGGVWAATRIYPGFTSDSPVGMFDYSDMPMAPILGMKYLEELPAQKVYDYLQLYAEKFSLLERMRLGMKVSKVTRNADGKAWDLEIENSEEVLSCDKLLVATGLSSKPHWPDVLREEFSGPVMHSKEIGPRHQELTSEEVKQVTVYGGCKSAVDAINLAIQAGKRVDWVIREEGNGPGMMIQVKKFPLVFLLARWKDFLMPSLFVSSGFWYNFLHSGQSKVGTWIRESIFKKLGKTPFKMGPYKTKSENLKKLMPEVEDALWQTNAANALHETPEHEEFIKQLHEGTNIIIHRAAITSMSGSNIVLSNGTTLTSDAAVFATGWEYSTSMFNPALALELGIPAPLKSEEADMASYWQDLSITAEKELLSAYPVLQSAPHYYKKELSTTPFRLYRHIIPHSLAAKRDRSLVFLGMLSNLSFPSYIEVASLYGISWLEGLLSETTIPGPKEIDYAIAKFNAWSALRYLSRGRTRMVAGGEIQSIIDNLMSDLGLEPHRKGWLADRFVPYSSQDYKGIVGEFLEKSRRLDSTSV